MELSFCLLLLVLFYLANLRTQGITSSCWIQLPGSAADIREMDFRLSELLAHSGSAFGGQWWQDLGKLATVAFVRPGELGTPSGSLRNEPHMRLPWAPWFRVIESWSHSSRRKGMLFYRLWLLLCVTCVTYEEHPVLNGINGFFNFIFDWATFKRNYVFASCNRLSSNACIWWTKRWILTKWQFSFFKIKKQ